MFILIGAMGLNREIGNKGTLPWKLPEDLVFFKRTTMGKTIIMGRKTYESIGGYLSGRCNIVISSEKLIAPGVISTSMEQFILTSKMNNEEDMYIIGGASIYKQLLPMCDKLLITEIQSTFEADTFMPEFDPDIFELTEQSDIMVSKTGLHYRFNTYTKKINK